MPLRGSHAPATQAGASSASPSSGFADQEQRQAAGSEPTSPAPAQQPQRSQRLEASLVLGPATSSAAALSQHGPTGADPTTASATRQQRARRHQHLSAAASLARQNVDQSARLGHPTPPTSSPIPNRPHPKQPHQHHTHSSPVAASSPRQAAAGLGAGTLSEASFAAHPRTLRTPTRSAPSSHHQREQPSDSDEPEQDLDSLASELVVARPITTDPFGRDDADQLSGQSQDSIGQELVDQVSPGTSEQSIELRVPDHSPIPDWTPKPNNWVSSLTLSRTLKEPAGGQAIASGYQRDHRWSAQQPRSELEQSRQTVEQQSWQFESEQPESLLFTSPELHHRQVLPTGTERYGQSPADADLAEHWARPASRASLGHSPVSPLSTRPHTTSFIAQDHTQPGATTPAGHPDDTDADNDSLISHRRRKQKRRRRPSQFAEPLGRASQSTGSLPGIFADAYDHWTSPKRRYRNYLLTGQWANSIAGGGSKPKRFLRSAFSSASSIFALYASRYAFDKFQLALRAFKEWYHENLTYHHLANRMEFNQQLFERWYNNRGRPLSLRALDHYDRVVIWIADERDAIQKRTFTKWINKYLMRRGKQIQDLFQDLRDGQGLISLLEMLSGQNLPRERGRMRVHNLQNIQIALNYIKLRKVKLVNIRPEDIADGNQKLTLGLIWTIILHFQLEDNSKFREILLRWAQKTTDGYPGCKVTDLTTTWRDGLAFNAIIHRNRPELLDYLGCRKKTSRDNLEQAFSVADRDLGVARLLEPEDVDVPCPDEKSMITYLAQLYQLFPDPPERNPLLDAEMIRRIDEYKELASQLLQWIKESTTRLDDRRFPKGIPELKKLKEDTERFRTQEVPPKQHDKQRLASVAHEIYKMAQDVRVKVPDDLHIDNIEYHWDRMMNALKARSKALDDEISKAERLKAMLDKLLTDIKKVNDRLDGIERQMNEEERRVSRMESLKDAESFSPSVLQKISEDLADCGIKIDSIKRLAEDFIQENGRTAPDSIMIREKVADLDGRYKKLLAKLNRLHDEYERTLKRLRGLEDAMRRAQAQKEAEAKLRLKLDEMKRQLDELERRIDNMGPIAKDFETLQKQLAELNEFDQDLNKARHNLNDLIKLAEGMIADDLIADPARLRSELQSLKDQLARIEEKAARRLRDFEAALKRAEDQKAAQQEIDLKLDGIKKELDELERRIDNMSPIGKDLATLQRQLDELRDFEHDVSRARRNLNDAIQLAENMIRQDLIADPARLRANINGLKDQLARIDEKVARRLKALQEALNRAEAQKSAEAKYRLRLDAIKRELDELERRLDNMAPVSKDLGELQRQLEEMQDFNVALNKARQNLNDVIKAGEDLIRDDLIAEPAELRKDMKALKDQLARIEDKAAKRLRDIQDAMGRVAASDAIQDVAKWLEHAKKVLINEENVHGDLDTVNALIEQHKSFQDELKSKQPAINEVRRMEKELSSASPETGAQIRKELQGLSNQWQEIERLTREKTSRLESALEGAEQMHGSVHDLLEFAADAESKLRFAGAMPDDENSINTELANHEKFMRKMVSQGQAKDQTLKLAQSIQSKCHPDAEPVIKHWINIIQSRWEEIEAWAEQRAQKLQDYKKSLGELLKLVEELISWLSRHEARLLGEEAEQLPTNADQLDGLIDAHSTFMDDLRKREPDVDRVVKIFASKSANATSKMIVTTTTTKPRPESSSRSGRLSGGARSATPTRTSYATYRDEYPDVRQPRAKIMLDKWRQVWQLSLDKMQRLKDRVEHLNEIERLENFDFDQWRRRFLTWVNANKGRVMDFFRSIDDNNDGRIPIESFISGILRSKFETSRLEMERVAEIFDKNNDGTIDNKEYLDSLRPDKPITDDEIIQDEVQRQVSRCTCAQRYRVYHVGEGRYRFGESQKLRLVRILRSTVMVRVGGGWEPLTSFLQKNDPCRAKGRTNVELREQFILPEGASQAMATFRSKMSRDTGSVPVLGPITKIREKTDRSMPMSGHGSRFGSPSDYYSESESTSKTRSRIGRLTPGSTSSRPTSRSASRPASRHGSDLT